MKTYCMLLVLAVACSAQGDDKWLADYSRRAPRTDDYARLMEHRQAEQLAEVKRIIISANPYRNPYFQPNSNYEPVKVGEPTFVHNEFSGKLGQPPRPFTDIMMKGTYTIHELHKTDEHNKRNRVDSY